MERAIKLSVSALPDSIQQPLTLRTSLTPPPLPLETAICFHHLLLRLRQLSWNQPAERAKESIRHLSAYWYQDKSEKVDSAKIQLYPVTPPLNATTKILLSGSPSFLAVSALLADLAALPSKQLFFGNLFQFDQESLSIQPVVGRLLNHSSITKSKRSEYTARLRISWPNRHLKIRTGEPLWLWELIHLLGICHTEQNLTLELPIELLNEPKNQTAWSLLCEHFRFQHILLMKNGNIQLSLVRSKKAIHPFSLQLPDEVREIIPDTDSTHFRGQILLALALPTDIYKLLGDELIWPTAERVPEKHLAGWEIYRQSRLYQQLLNVLQVGTTQAGSKNETTTAVIDVDIPYPESLLLNELTNFGQVTPAEIQPEKIDHFLANLFKCPSVEHIELSGISRVPETVSGGASSEKKFKKSIAQQLSAHGIPNFPEQYLYFLDQPEMCHYSIAPPLTVKSSLLGQFELEDAQGQIIAGYGEELEQTLLFCSQSEKMEIDIPNDRHQLAQLLHYYQKDLKNLYNYLNNCCYSQVENSKSARKLARNTWKKLNLPDSSWFMD